SELHSALGGLGLLTNLADFVLHARQHIVHMNDAGAKVGSDPVANPRGRPRAHVCLDEDCEQLAEEFLIDEATLALKKIANVRVEDIVRFLQRRAEHSEPALLRRGLFWLRRWRTPLPCRGVWLVWLFFEAIEDTHR